MRPKKGPVYISSRYSYTFYTNHLSFYSISRKSTQLVVGDLRVDWTRYVEIQRLITNRLIHCSVGLRKELVSINKNDAFFQIDLYGS